MTDTRDDGLYGTLQDTWTSHFNVDDPITFLFEEPTVAPSTSWGMLAFLRPVAYNHRSSARTKQQQQQQQQANWCIGIMSLTCHAARQLAINGRPVGRHFDLHHFSNTPQCHGIPVHSQTLRIDYLTCDWRAYTSRNTLLTWCPATNMFHIHLGKGQVSLCWFLSDLPLHVSWENQRNEIWPCVTLSSTRLYLQHQCSYTYCWLGDRKDKRLANSLYLTISKSSCMETRRGAANGEHRGPATAPRSPSLN